VKIFCDFDGTITYNDTWVEMAKEFIKDTEGWNKLINQFVNLEIGARECFIKECEMLVDYDFESFNKIIDDQKIDPGFHSFVEFCRTNELELTILSEGMDYYIGRILKHENLEIPFYANAFIPVDNKKFRLEFPNSDSECKRCGCCKRNFLLNMTGDNEISVFIGDGFSDACVAHYADIVFAKKGLASYCWKNNITYFDYVTFHDVSKKLEKILAQKNIKHRQTAKLKRRDAFIRG